LGKIGDLVAGQQTGDKRQPRQVLGVLGVGRGRLGQAQADVAERGEEQEGRGSGNCGILGGSG